MAVMSDGTMTNPRCGRCGLPIPPAKYEKLECPKCGWEAKDEFADMRHRPIKKEECELREFDLERME